MVKESNPSGPRQRILAAALRHFTRRGFRQAALAEIAREAGLVKGAVYYYFPEGKQGLFDAVASGVEDEVLAAMERSARGPRDARAALLAVFRAKLRVLVALRDRLGVGPEVVEEMLSLARQRPRSFRAGERDLIARILARGAEEGVFRPLVPGPAAAAVQSALAGAFSDSLATRAGSPTRLASSVLDLVLRGLQAPSGPGGAA